jgi:hypothetical protein
VQRLRQTSCLHLAMRGAAKRAIRSSRDNQDLSTTQRYMHLRPAAVERAIRLLEQLNPLLGRGDRLETGDCLIRYLQSAERLRHRPCRRVRCTWTCPSAPDHYHSIRTRVELTALR